MEITLEVNPGTVERERLPGFREAGVGRLSVGVQSFDDAVLRRLGRAHKAAEGRATLEAVRRAGFPDVSIDLLWGVPGRDRAGLARELDEAVAFAPEHVSAYELTVEEGTPYARAVARGQLVPPDPDEAAERYALVRERLAAAGLAAYEISSYARPGRRSRHNQRYWRREPVLGLGPGAWSTEPRRTGAPHGARRGNERALEAWLRRVEDASSAAPPAEALSPATARGEALLLALRTADGLRAAAFESEFGAPPRAFHGERIAALVDGGLLLESPAGDLRLSSRGWPLADAVAIEFLEPAPLASAPLGGLR